MAVLLVTYDLDKPGQDYTDVLNTIKSYPWARLSESCYAIETSESPRSIFTKLTKYLDSNDQLYVITLTRPWSGRGPNDVNQWLIDRLGLAQ